MRAVIVGVGELVSTLSAERVRRELASLPGHDPMNERGHADGLSVQDMASDVRNRFLAVLPGHSPLLPEDDQAKLEGEVEFVRTLAERLDETGDAGGKAGTESNYHKLVQVLDGITRTK